MASRIANQYVPLVGRRLHGLGIAKIDQKTIAQELGDVTIIACDHFRTGL